jgi:hypothetical protein
VTSRKHQNRDGEKLQAKRAKDIRIKPWCIGCGYYFAAHGEHREDCTAQAKRRDDSP